MHYHIQKREKDEDGYFTIHWSPLLKADKYEIHQNVPAMGGIAELYYRQDGHFVLFRLVRSWFGGIRAVVRSSTDPEEEKDLKLKAILEAHKGEIYYRYAICEQIDDINDVLFFLYETMDPDNNPVDHSGRYEHIWLNEEDPPQKEKL